jgi:hypothetical protein
MRDVNTEVMMLACSAKVMGLGRFFVVVVVFVCLFLFFFPSCSQ